MVRRLGAVQLDTISVLARSHELVAYARHGAVGRAAVERAYWGRGARPSSTGPHAACVIPLEDWPLYEFKRRARRAKGKRWHDLADRERTLRRGGEPPAGRRAPDGQRARWGQEGRACGGTGPRRRSPPSGCSTWATSCAESGEGSSGSTTWPSGPSRPTSARPSSPTRSAPCGWWPPPAAPSASARWATWPSTTACPSAWCAWCSPMRDWCRSGSRAGSPWPMPIRPPSPRWVGRAKGRSLLLSPFDSLCLVPGPPRTALRGAAPPGGLHAAAQRTYGYFAMPVLGETEIVGLVDPGRRDGALVAKQVTALPGDGMGHVAAALGAAARWVGCDRVIVERVAPLRRLDEASSRSWPRTPPTSADECSSRRGPQVAWRAAISSKAAMSPR